jgi:hypothetical protein
LIAKKRRGSIARDGFRNWFLARLTPRLAALMVDSSPTGTLDSAGDSELNYESVEPWAIVALLLGLLAPAALAAPLLWFLPILGLLAAAAALRKISRATGRPGRWLSLVGLALSAFFLTTAVARVASTHWLLARQARPVADQFVEFLREGSPEKALMLNRSAEFRHPLDEGMWSYFRRNEDARKELTAFVRDKTIRMILALGNRAEVRYYRTSAAGNWGDTAQVDLWYTVTFTDTDGRKKTYILGLLMERRATDPDLNPWRVRDYAGGIDPFGR